ncbi:MAG TPA: VOC family protein [Actinopolymorphaceae bacterium]|nr:VOC family protein [Actinopolymorphaceae bacterium]
MRIHHVQVSCPAGGEDAARAFYAGALGMVEVEKPPVLAARGGAWFRSVDGVDGVDGAAELHVGVEADFRPAAKAHPAFYVDNIDAVAARVVAAGFDADWDNLYPGHRRFYAADGNGNRVEILGPDGSG